MIPDSENLRESPQMIEIRQSELEDVPTETCHLFVPENLLESYRNDEVWGWFKHIHAIHLELRIGRIQRQQRAGNAGMGHRLEDCPHQ